MKESRLAPGPGNTDSAETSAQKPVDRGMFTDNWLSLVLFRCKLHGHFLWTHDCHILFQRKLIWRS